MRFLFCLIILFISTQADDNYQLGRGLQLGSSSNYIGGYFSVEYKHAYGKERSLKLDDVAVMLYGSSNENLSYMLELEADSIYNEVYGDESSEEVQEHLHIERLFMEYEFNENYSLRAGKYNSPIGFWNINPINVLRDTTSSPLITKLLFPKFTTGLDLSYNSLNQSSNTFHIMAQENRDIDSLMNDDVYNNFDLNRHYGLGLSWENKMWSYQLNGGYFETLDGNSYSYALGAFEYTHQNFKLMGEVGTQWDREDSSIPYIAYFQYSQLFSSHQEAILRLESYKSKVDNKDDTFMVFGYTYRPLPPIAIKGEYQWHSIDKENKLLLSLSILF